MRIGTTRLLLMLGIMALIFSPAMAGKNAGGALVVHTDDYFQWRNPSEICNRFDDEVPQECIDLNTQTDADVNTPATIWFIAAFPGPSVPGVTVAYFGNDHNLPELYHNRWGYCDNGTYGTIEVPDAGWPESPATAGNSVAYGTPILGDTFFPVYYFSVWGFTDAYYSSTINPTGGYAAFVDDSNPPVTDLIELFGSVRWYEPGYNECPTGPGLPGACCLPDGSCILTIDEAECLAAGGYLWMGVGTVCDPNPCPGACCFYNNDCEITTEDQCTAMGGMQWLAGAECGPDRNPCLGNPCPPPGDDVFDTSDATFAFEVPGETGLLPVTVSGPTIVRRYEATLDPDGHCEIETEIIEMNLEGTYDPDICNGLELPVTITLDPDAPPSQGIMISSIGADGEPDFPIYSEFAEVHVLVQIGTYEPFPYTVLGLAANLQDDNLWRDCLRPREDPYEAGFDPPKHMHVTCVLPEPPNVGCCVFGPELGGGGFYTRDIFCAALGGTYLGDNVPCDPADICDEPGACCYGCDSCTVLTQSECENLPDDYMWIEGEDCTPNPCPPVAIETSTWGEIKAKYK